MLIIINYNLLIGVGGASNDSIANSENTLNCSTDVVTSLSNDINSRLTSNLSDTVEPHETENGHSEMDPSSQLLDDDITEEELRITLLSSVEEKSY